MSDNVSNAIIWFYEQPSYVFEYAYDEIQRCEVRTGKLIRRSESIDIEYFAPFEKRIYERGMIKNLEIINALRAENETLRNNRFKFWKKMSQ
jgi:hypothetical protein